MPKTVSQEGVDEAVLEAVASEGATGEAEELGIVVALPTQPFHEFLFPLTVRGIAVKTEAIQQGGLSAAASFDSEQGRISTPQFFRPKAFFDSRPKSCEQACGWWGRRDRPSRKFSSS